MHRCSSCALDCLVCQSEGHACLADGGKSVIVKYLTSSKLTKLQLRDAAFRRTLLLQCLILLHACAHPKHAVNKPPAHQLKEKQVQLCFSHFVVQHVLSDALVPAKSAIIALACTDFLDFSSCNSLYCAHPDDIRLLLMPSKA